MSDHPNAARYRELTKAFEAGDTAAMAASMAEGVEWHEIGAAEPIRGRDALMSRMQSLGDYEISADLHDVVANDDHMIALLNVTARKGDETFSYRTAEVYHVDAEGRATERWAFSDDTQAIIEFFS